MSDTTPNYSVRSQGWLRATLLVDVCTIPNRSDEEHCPASPSLADRRCLLRGVGMIDLAAFVPRLAAELATESGSTWTNVDGSMLSADISGFTALGICAI